MTLQQSAQPTRRSSYAPASPIRSLPRRWQSRSGSQQSPPLQSYAGEAETHSALPPLRRQATVCCSIHSCSTRGLGELLPEYIVVLWSSEPFDLRQTYDKSGTDGCRALGVMTWLAVQPNTCEITSPLGTKKVYCPISCLVRSSVVASVQRWAPANFLFFFLSTGIKELSTQPCVQPDLLLHRSSLLQPPQRR